MERRSYFAEQLCTIGVAGAYALVMTAMWWQTWHTIKAGTGEYTLLMVLAPWIQHVVVAGSVVLFVLAVLRAIGVWRAAGQIHSHDHHHHDHEHTHDHGHDHAHNHAHDHAHDHGHSHGWSPWRYAVLLFPLLLFFLPLDYNQMINDYLRELRGQLGSSGAPAGIGGNPSESLAPIGLLSLSQSPVDRAVASLVFNFGEPAWKSLAQEIDRTEEEANIEPQVTPEVDEFDKIGGTEEQRAAWRAYRRVETRGFFGPMDDRRFQVVRYSIRCCIVDVRPSMVFAMSRKRIKDTIYAETDTGLTLDRNFDLRKLGDQQWVRVQGRVEFFFDKSKNRWQPVMLVFKVIPTKTPANPYLP